MPKKIDIDGVELELDDAIADKVIAKRQETKEALRKKDESLTQAQARLAALEAEKAEANRQAEIAKLTNKGEYEAALKRVEESHQAKLRKASEHLARQTLRAQIAARADVLPEAIDDILAQTVSSCVHDIETNTLAVMGEAGRPALGADGRPVGVDTLISSFLEKRPYLRRPSGSPGSGGTGAGGTGGAARTIPVATYETMTTAEKSAFFAAGGKVA